MGPRPGRDRGKARSPGWNASRGTPDAVHSAPPPPPRRAALAPAVHPPATPQRSFRQSQECPCAAAQPATRTMAASPEGVAEGKSMLGTQVRRRGPQTHGRRPALPPPGPSRVAPPRRAPRPACSHAAGCPLHVVDTSGRRRRPRPGRAEGRGPGEPGVGPGPPPARPASRGGAPAARWGHPPEAGGPSSWMAGAAAAGLPPPGCRALGGREGPGSEGGEQRG